MKYEIQIFIHDMCVYLSQLYGELKEEGRREKGHATARVCDRVRDTDKCILFEIFRLGSNPRYQFTLHTVLTLKL